MSSGSTFESRFEDKREAFSGTLGADSDARTERDRGNLRFSCSSAGALRFLELASPSEGIGESPSVRSESSSSWSLPISDRSFPLSLAIFAFTIWSRLPCLGLLLKFAMDRKPGVPCDLATDRGAVEGARGGAGGKESVTRWTMLVEGSRTVEPGGGAMFSSGEGERAEAKRRLPASVFPWMPLA